MYSTTLRYLSKFESDCKKTLKNLLWSDNERFDENCFSQNMQEKICSKCFESAFDRGVFDKDVDDVGEWTLSTWDWSDAEDEKSL
jgi:hypothetical protein